MAAYDPDQPAVGGGIFGLPTPPDESAVVLIPVPWEATVCYGVGTRNGPAAILQASRQLDLVDRETGRPYTKGIAMLREHPEVVENAGTARELATPVLQKGGPGTDSGLAQAATRVNLLCQDMNHWVYRTTCDWQKRGKLTGVVGGDHSVPFGHIQAIAEKYPGMGILQIDAHADLRDAYGGFTWSHASIMYNVFSLLPDVSRIIQVGIRDYAPQEDSLIHENPDRISVFFDADLKRRQQEGETWKTLTGEIVNTLPSQVYLSFDVDGLDPTLCPNTGTPVPGGLSFSEATGLMREIVESGREIVGFDLCETAPDPTGKSEWDGNVGARLIYKMLGFALKSKG